MQLNYTILEILLELFLAALSLRKEFTQRRVKTQRRNEFSQPGRLGVKRYQKTLESLYKLLQQFYSFFNRRVRIKQTVKKTFFMILWIFDKKLRDVFAMNCFN